MKRLLGLAIASVLFWVMSACAPVQAPAGLSDADRQDIEAISQQFEQHFVAGDWDALVALYTEDAIFMPPNQPAMRGRQALKSFAASFPKVTSADIQVEEIDGRGDLAYVRGRFSMTLMPEGAAGPITDTGKYLEIRRKQPDGRWLLAIDIFNSDAPPAAEESTPAQ